MAEHERILPLLVEPCSRSSTTLIHALRRFSWMAVGYAGRKQVEGYPVPGTFLSRLWEQKPRGVFFFIMFHQHTWHATQVTFSLTGKSGSRCAGAWNALTFREPTQDLGLWQPHGCRGGLLLSKFSLDLLGNDPRHEESQNNLDFYVPCLRVASPSCFVDGSVRQKLLVFWKF